MRRRARPWLHAGIPLAALLLLALLGRGPLPGPWGSGGASPPAAPAADDRGAQLASLFRERASGVWVEGGGTVAAVLPDDRRGDRHQRLILRVGPGHTVLLSHNIDLAPRLADVAEGDRVAFRGRYEWNPEGGVVHWTHHDPEGRRPGGWLRHEGRTYR